MSASCDCVLSARGLRDGLITLPDESNRVCVCVCVCVCVLVCVCVCVSLNVVRYNSTTVTLYIYSE